MRLSEWGWYNITTANKGALNFQQLFLHALLCLPYLSVSPSSGSNERYKSLPILPRHVIDAANRFRLCGGIVMSILLFSSFQIAREEIKRAMTFLVC